MDGWIDRWIDDTWMDQRDMYLCVSEWVRTLVCVENRGRAAGQDVVKAPRVLVSRGFRNAKRMRCSGVT